MPETTEEEIIKIRKKYPKLISANNQDIKFTIGIHLLRIIPEEFLKILFEET